MAPKPDKIAMIRMVHASQIGVETKSSISVEKDKATLEFHPAGVYVQMKGFRTIIPYANMSAITLAVDVPDAPRGGPTDR